MQKTKAIVKLVVLLTILILLFPLKATKEKKGDNEERKTDIFQSEVIDVSRQGKHFISLNRNTWPTMENLNDEILIVNFVLQQSNEVSCENDLKKSNLIMRIAAHAKGQTGSYNRLFFSDLITSDTIQLSSQSTVGNTGIKDYTFAFPIGNLSCFHNDEISIELEIIQGDDLVNSLNPLITVKKNSEQISDAVFKGGFILNILFYLIIILVFILIVMEIVYLFGDDALLKHPE